jgi:hypothetical protein
MQLEKQAAAGERNQNAKRIDMEKSASYLSELK